MISKSKKSVILALVGDEKVAAGEIKFDRAIKESFFKNETQVKFNPVTDTSDWEADLVEVYIKVRMNHF